ncbi:MAG: hypothetical protein I3J02_03230 [Prevotella sp.]|nr:hypothetical protein [Prevotella sp.]
MQRFIYSLILSLAVISSSAQALVFKAPVDYDYDNLRHVEIKDGHYTIGQLKKGRFVPVAPDTSRPLDFGGETTFTAFLSADGDHAVLTPSNRNMHQREASLYSLGDRVLMAQNIVRDEAASRLDTTYMMSFKVRKLMTQEGLPKDYDGPFELEMDITPDDTTTTSSVEMVNDEGDTLTLQMDKPSRMLTLTQGSTRITMSLQDAVDEDMAGVWHLNLMISRQTAEVFVNEGRGVMSHSITLNHPLSTVRLMSEGGKTKFSNICIYRKPIQPLRLTQ